MKQIPKTWTLAEEKVPTSIINGSGVNQGIAYWDSKGKFRMVHLVGQHWCELGWGYSGQEEAVMKQYEPLSS